MIRHIVFFTTRDRSEVATVRDGLLALGRIAHHRHFEVVENGRIDPFGNEIDLVVYAEFDDWDALARYKSDPIYQATTDEVRPMRELRFSADYEVADASLK